MRFVCVSDDGDARVYDDYWSDDPVHVATEHAEHCDEQGGEGPSERVVYVRDLDDPDGKVVAVSVGYEMEPVYTGCKSNNVPDASLLKEMNDALDACREVWVKP